MLEYSGGKAFTSTGVSPWQDAYMAQEHIFLIESDTSSTGSFQIQHRMKNGTNTAILSSGTINASSVMSYQFTGAFYQHRVRMKTVAATVTARWLGN